MSILCLAEIVVDWLSLEPGASFHTATQWYRALGGNSANVAIGLARLGAHVRLVGKIGNDLPGEFLRCTLEQEKVDCSHLLTDEKAPTAQCYMTMTAQGEHQYYNWPRPHAADLLRSDEINIVKLLADTTAVHTTAISLLQDPRRSAVKTVVRAIKESGGVVSFDAGLLRTGDVHRHTEELMRMSDVIKMNEPEVWGWSQTLLPWDYSSSDARNDGSESASHTVEETQVLARIVFDQIKPKAMLVTLSARGSLVVTRDHLIYCPPHKVEAASEVGAGDAYVAGVLRAICVDLGVDRAEKLDSLTESDWKSIGITGNIAGALAATHPSAYAGMPDREKLAKVLATVMG